MIERDLEDIFSRKVSELLNVEVSQERFKELVEIFIEYKTAKNKITLSKR